MPEMIILDRDGVINQDSDDYIKSVDEWIPIPGSLKAIRRLKDAGYLVTVATNQSGIARGYFDEKMLQQIHNKMHGLLAQLDSRLDGVFHCPHGPHDNCACRKPRPGLLLQIAQRFNIDMSATPFVGDTMSDIKAAEAAHARPILVRTGKGETIMQKFREVINVPVYDDLAHFVDETLKNRRT